MSNVTRPHPFRVFALLLTMGILVFMAPSPPPIAAMPTPNAMTFVDKLLQIASKDIGVEEDPRGSNWGTREHPRVRQMIERAGYKVPVYWCDCAVYTWVDEACLAIGRENPMPRTGDCDLTLVKGRKAGLEVFDPIPGDQFFVMASRNDAIHTGIVLSRAAGGKIRTIEGNSNTDGSRNGIMVAERQRNATGLVYIRWANAVEPGWTLKIGSQAIPLVLIDGTNIAPVREVVKALGLPDASLAYDPDSHGIKYDGRLIPARPQLVAGSSYLPVRALTSFFDQSFTVDNTRKVVTVTK